jgi:hypothetical protein
MKWRMVLPLILLTGCLPQDSKPVDAPFMIAMPWVSTVRQCERTPQAPDGLMDVPKLEAYIAEISARLETCADKLDTQNKRIERARRRKG